MSSGEDHDGLDSNDRQQSLDDINNAHDLEERDSLLNEALYSDRNAKVNYVIVKVTRR